jgi:rhodanese-related sulfurtransferase
MTPSNIDARIADARSRISVIGPHAAARLRDAGALFVDTRPVAQREQFGAIPDAVIIDRNVLEWRLDPTSGHRHPAAAAHDGPIVVFCQEGYSSSLAVESLVQVGVTDVHDLAGGFAAWSANGLPIT